MITGKQAVAVAMILIIAIPILAGYAFATENVTRDAYAVDDTKSISDMLQNAETYSFDNYTGPNNNGALIVGGIGIYSFSNPDFVVAGTKASTVPIGVPATYSLALTSGQYTDVVIDNGRYTTVFFDTANYNTSLQLTFADGSVEEYGSETGYEVFKTGSFVQLKEPGYNPATVYNLVVGLAIKMNDGDLNTLTLTYFQPTANLRADPAYGWRLPDTTNIYGWANGYSNNSVVFYLHMDIPENGSVTASFEPCPGGGYLDHYGIDFTLSQYGNMTVNPTYSSDSYLLGSYTDVQIVYDLYNETCTVSGISRFPAMGADPAIYASVEFATPDDMVVTEFPIIFITGSDEAIWRCDKASIISGTMTATVDYTLDIVSLFPNNDIRLNLNSIGIYGSSLTIAGHTYDVEDGAIEIDGETVRLKGAVIQIVRSGTYFVTTINDIAVDSRPVLLGNPTIVFGGVWWITSTVDLLVTYAETVQEWAPGVFAFDKDSFILMIIFAAAAVFVALGFTAGRSGGKVLLLAIACGGAAVIALILV